MNFDVVYYSIVFMLVVGTAVGWYLHKHDIRLPFL